VARTLLGRRRGPRPRGAGQVAPQPHTPPDTREEPMRRGERDGGALALALVVAAVAVGVAGLAARARPPGGGGAGPGPRGRGGRWWSRCWSGTGDGPPADHAAAPRGSTVLRPPRAPPPGHVRASDARGGGRSESRSWTPRRAGPASRPRTPTTSHGRFGPPA